MRLSVCIYTYNHEPYIEQSVKVRSIKMLISSMRLLSEKIVLQIKLQTYFAIWKQKTPIA